MNGYQYYGAGSGSVWSITPQCDGSEENILDCYNYVYSSSYSHSSDVGVICSSKLQTSNIILMQMSCFSLYTVQLIPR